MRRVVLLVILFSLGAYLTNGKSYDSEPAPAVEAGRATPASAVPTAADRADLADLIAGLTLAPANVIAAKEAIGADQWQMAGFTGHDVRIAVVDTGFDGYQVQLGVSLPDTVHARSFRSDGRLEAGSEHGTLAAEIIHSIAPRAELYLANFGTVEEFADLAGYLESEHVDIVSFSLGFVHNGPGDGTGQVDDVITKAVDSGQLWVVAAGNWAHQHWAGTFIDRNHNMVNDFAPGVEDNSRVYRAGDLITVSMRWDEPWGFACTDYDLELFGPDGSLVQASRNGQNCFGDPVESLQVLATKSGTYRTRIVESGSSGHTPRIDLLMLGAPDRSQPLDYYTQAGSLAEPADHPGVLTIGAEDPFGSTPVASFSSQGPTKDGRPKPDLLAPTGVATGGEQTFSGTSAATPHAAGAAALLLEAFPGSTAPQIMQQLRDRATPPAAPNEGAGMLELGSLNDVGPVLPPGDGLASLTGSIPSGAGTATLRYSGPDGFPARFAHLILEGREPVVYYRAASDGHFDAFVVDAPRYASSFEVFNNGDIVLAQFGPPDIEVPAGAPIPDATGAG
jgi:subtilisin family serine protease